MKADRVMVTVPRQRWGHLVWCLSSFLGSLPAVPVHSFPIGQCPAPPLRRNWYQQPSLRTTRTSSSREQWTALQLFSASESGSARRSANATVPSSPSRSYNNLRNRRQSPTAATTSAAPAVPLKDNEAVQDPSLSSSSASSSAPIPGIGGLGGIVYDVNKLKRNLLQETVRQYKQDLLSLLSNPRTTEQDVTWKLGALVQGSAVRTTTDSNLLDNGRSKSLSHSSAGGKKRKSEGNVGGANDGDGANGEAQSLWTMAYTSRYTHLEDLLTPMPTEPRRRRRENRSRQQQPEQPLSPAAKRRSGKQAWTCTRFLEFHLEGDITLQPPDPLPLQTQATLTGRVSRRSKANPASAPYTVDTRQYLGGLIQLQEVWKVCGLTRTNLALSHEKTMLALLGRPVIKVSAPSPPRKKNVQVVYLDVNLAVLAETSIDSSLAATTKSLSRPHHGTKSPTYTVFTKSPAWSQGRARRRRKLRLALDTIRYWLWDSQQRSAFLLSSHHNRTPEDEVNRILQELQLDTSSRLRVLKLGQVPDPTPGTYDDQEAAWEGPLDPFVHLSADERQELLKGMNIRDIEKAGDQQVARSKREQGWFQQVLNRRRTWFKKPSNGRA